MSWSLPRGPFRTGAILALAAASVLTPSPPSHVVGGSMVAKVLYVPSCDSGPATSKGVPRFWTEDRACYRSPWFGGAHRVMIPFGCTAAPYYPPAPACSRGRGIHHGIDIDMPVGTRIFSKVKGTVVKGTLGTAYGGRAFLIRTARRDYVLGHVSAVLVAAGERVRPGQLVAKSGALGAPDGPHLHFEVRPRGGSHLSAMNPRARLELREAIRGPTGCC